MSSLEKNKSNIEDAELKSAQLEIEKITSKDLSELVDMMPSDGSLVQHFAPLGNCQWIYRFHFKSLLAEFNAIGFGVSPTEAFAAARETLRKQIQEWHETRDKKKFYVGKDHSAFFWQLTSTTKPKKSKNKDLNGAPTVLIIEDDADIAAATALAFKKLGCNTIISNGQNGAAHTMSFQDVDFIVLDWMLGEDLSADKLVKRSSRIIDAFKDLRLRFKQHHGKIITYSVLDRSQIHVPENQYFEHLDHWQKPFKPNELITRAAEVLNAK